LLAETCSLGEYCLRPLPLLLNATKIFDDVGDEIVDGTLDIRSFTKKARHYGIDVFILMQGNLIRAGTHGRSIRKNLSHVIAFRTCCIDVLDLVHKDKHKEYKARIETLRNDDQRVGVIFVNNSSDGQGPGSRRVPLGVQGRRDHQEVHHHQPLSKRWRSCSASKGKGLSSRASTCTS
jgi:hypothetical protein